MHIKMICLKPLLERSALKRFNAVEFPGIFGYIELWVDGLYEGMLYPPTVL